MIRLDTVRHQFDGGAPVLDGVSFCIPTGGTLGIIGPGGAGKSLVLKVICGLLKPAQGRVWVDEHEVNQLSERALMKVRRRIGMVFQNYALFDDRTVGENIAFPLEQLGTVPANEIPAEVALRLAQVHLPGIEHKRPGALSGGMKKRVCLARAIVHRPPILLCDDPTAGLDPVTTNRIFSLLKQMQAEQNATLVIVSHEVGYLAPICDRFVMLDEGRVVFDGTVPEAQASAVPVVQQFVQGVGI
jgi:phospholipid/cholesterol/gamma-HCH transport system ATP-binding protein